ncbi:MAG: 30S ribosomal protein S7 [Candidatus Gottesmanbacteria bacterium]
MRAGHIKKRIIEADPLYNSVLVNRFINRVMKDGKKGIAQRLVYGALEDIKSKGKDPIKTLEDAIANISPRMEVRPRRVGGASYQVPSEVRGDRRISLAIRWMINAANNRSNKEFHTFDKKLSTEIIDASQGLGEAIRKRDQMQKMADANRAFAHFRW